MACSLELWRHNLASVASVRTMTEAIKKMNENSLVDEIKETSSLNYETLCFCVLVKYIQRTCYTCEYRVWSHAPVYASVDKASWSPPWEKYILCSLGVSYGKQLLSAFLLIVTSLCLLNTGVKCQICHLVFWRIKFFIPLLSLLTFR